MRRFIVGFSFVFCLFGFISCSNLNRQADALRLKDNFDDAFALYSQSAEEGSAYAKWRMADAYFTGNGAEYDITKGKELLEAAASEGCEQAIAYLACCHLYGWDNYQRDSARGRKMLDDVALNSDSPYVMTLYATMLYDEDEKKAVEILRSLDGCNEPLYWYAMGSLYSDGSDHIECDTDKALECYKRAYELGSISAAGELGQIFLNNTDTTEAIRWYEKGVKRHNVACMNVLATFYIDKNFKQFNISKGLRLLEKAGTLGSGDSYGMLGDIYYKGDIVNKDDELAFDYYKKASELHDLRSAYNVGSFYVNGIGCKKDIEKGIAIWKEAASFGYSSAACNLYCYYQGSPEYGGSKATVNDELAKKYLLQSANAGEVHACMNIGKHYAKGTNLFEQDIWQAFFYFKKAADAGYIDACTLVSYMYENGLGCDKNPKEAKRYKDMTKAEPDKENKDD